MGARLASLFRRGPRPRTADDDDWGTSSPDPPLPMDRDVVAPDPHALPGADESHHPVLPKPASKKFHKLKAQELSAYTVTFSPRLVISVYFAIGILFVPIGAAIIAGTARIRTAGPFRYDDRETCSVGKTCGLVFNVSQNIPAPSYLYYSMGNYFQNARKYAKSRSDSMNEGSLPKVPFDVENCEPWLYRPLEKDRSFDPNKFIYPCGLTARSFFNDTFSVCNNEGEKDQCDKPLKVREDNITWWTDREHKFKKGSEDVFTTVQTNISYNENQTGNALLSNEHFIVWMRLSAFPDFSKLYGVIEETLVANRSYKLFIDNRYSVEEFAGSKSLHITTTQWFGGSNAFLGTAYLVVGFIAFFIATTMLVKHVRNPRPPAHLDTALIMRELAKFNAEFRKDPADA